MLLKPRRGKKDEDHLIQESLLQHLRTPIEELEGTCHKFNATIATSMVTMLDIVQKITMLQGPTTTGPTIEGNKLVLLVKKVIILKRDKENQGMIIMQLRLNHSTFLFLLLLIHLLQILVIVGWLIVVLQDTLLVTKYSLIWLRGRQI